MKNKVSFSFFLLALLGLGLGIYGCNSKSGPHSRSGRASQIAKQADSPKADKRITELIGKVIYKDESIVIIEHRGQTYVFSEWHWAVTAQDTIK